MSTAGFYKLDGDTLLYSPTTVESATYMLHADRHEDHEYPVDGWHWFDSEEEAVQALRPSEPQATERYNQDIPGARP